MRLKAALVLGLGALALVSSSDLAGQGAGARVVAPAVYRSGAVPAQPVLAVGGGEVIVELTVGRSGAVTNVRPLRVTASFTEFVVGAVKLWQFTPAEELVDPANRKPGEGPTRPVESKVIVAALFRPPSVYVGTLGSPIEDIGRASPDVPFPLATVMPTYPPNILNAGVVLVEARVSAAGKVTGVNVKSPAPSLNEPALAAARQWTFRGASGSGAAVSRVYLIFGFREPVLGGPPQLPSGTSPPKPENPPPN